MSLHTNITRLQLQGNCLCYECGSSKILTFEDIKQIQKYVESLSPKYIYQHPRIYSPQELQFDKLPIYLSRGESLYLSVSFFQEVPKYTIVEQISAKFLRSIEFLYAQKINSCFNPFEQKENIIPGFSVRAIIDHWGIGLALLPVNLHLQKLSQISSAQLFVDYSKGVFYSRDDIVRIDKNSGIISFREGQSASLRNLKKTKITNISGFMLASKLSNYIQRIKQSSQILIQSWQIKFQNRFFTIQAKMVHPGSISFRNNTQRFVNDLIYPMARNSYNHYFRNFFKDVIFQQRLEMQLVFLLPQMIFKEAKMIVKQIEKVTQRMGLKVKCNYFCFPGFQKRQEVERLFETVKKNPNLSMNILILPTQLLKKEQDHLKQFKQLLINQRIFFHSFQFQEIEKDELDIIAIRHLAIIYSKMRLNPWKMKNIPFGEKAAAVCSLDIQQTHDGRYSIAIVSSLNSFFSKFISLHMISDQQNYKENIFILLRKCLDKFCATHKLFPMRVFVFRSGISQDFAQQFLEVKDRLQKYYQQINNNKMNTLTFIKTSYLHPIRTCYRSDETYITHQTVKKTQLLSTFELLNKFYIQVQFNEPPLELQIIEIEKDPNFISKVLELAVRLIFSTPGNIYGQGLGFLGYASRLNQYRDFNIKAWEEHQMQGFLMFL